MTTLFELETLNRRMADANRDGFIIRMRHPNAVRVCLDTAIWTAAADDVTVHYAESVEDALRFVEGATWAKEFLRISGALK